MLSSGTGALFGDQVQEEVPDFLLSHLGRRAPLISHKVVSVVQIRFLGAGGESPQFQISLHLLANVSHSCAPSVPARGFGHWRSARKSATAIEGRRDDRQ